MHSFQRILHMNFIEVKVEVDMKALFCRHFYCPVGMLKWSGRGAGKLNQWRSSNTSDLKINTN